MAAFRLGMIVNPIAGMGGAVGLKGSDTSKIISRARELGATPKSPLRAGEALAAIAAGNADIEIIVAPGNMGEAEARAAGFLCSASRYSGLFRTYDRHHTRPSSQRSRSD